MLEARGLVEYFFLLFVTFKEREEFHRLKMVKAKKIRAQTLANMRFNAYDGRESPSKGK